MNSLIDKLSQFHTLTPNEYELLIENQTDGLFNYAKEKANEARHKIYKNSIYIRGLIEISNVCKNDCLYCGIRRSNSHCSRYVLDKNTILDCCEKGYNSGFRTFVLQSGESAFSVKKICETVYDIKNKFPDCAITLSLGEYKKSDYQNMYKSGADRYLLRHETADFEHYKRLHPPEMSFDNRIKCLYNLKEIGYQVGCGFMVGSPYQTSKTIAKDLKFIEEFEPDMCGIGPFIHSGNTPFAIEPSGSVLKTLYLLSLIRLIKPNILLPATTALGTLKKGGRELGILAGANVVMPNLSPKSKRADYSLYDNKLYEGEESAEGVHLLSESLSKIGYKIDFSRGDIIK